MLRVLMARQSMTSLWLIQAGWRRYADFWKAGDDIVHLTMMMLTNFGVKMGTGDETIINADSNDTLLDGEAGSDWLAFTQQSTGVLQARRRTQLTQATPKILKIFMAQTTTTH